MPFAVLRSLFVILASTLFAFAVLPWLSGVLVGATGWQLSTALGVSCILLLLVLSGYYYAVRRAGMIPEGMCQRRFAQSFGVLLLAATLFVWAVVRLYHPLLDGLVSVGGGDAANHVYYAHQLASGDTSAYNRMLSFHAGVLTLINFFDFDYFEAFRICFYMVVFFVLWFYSRLSVYSSNTTRLGLVLSFCLLLLPLEYILLPALHYLQADGFYPQVLGILPVLLSIQVYPYCRTMASQFVLLGVSLLLVRYSYALHCGDMAAGFALVFLGQAWRGRNLLFLLAALCAAALACWAFLRLSPVYALPGHTQAFEFFPVAVLLLCSGALFLVVVLRSYWKMNPEVAPPSPHTRLLAISGSFIVSVLAAIFLRGLWQGEFGYYHFKAMYTPLFVAIFGLVLLQLESCLQFVRTLVGSIRCAQRARLGRFLPPACIFLIASGIVCAFPSQLRVLRASYYERAEGGLPLRQIQALADREAWKHIERVLTQTEKQFGGYISEPQWALAHFMNAGLGYFRYRQQPLYRDPRVRIEKGFCVFWNSTPETIERLHRVDRSWAGKLVEELDAKQFSETIVYRTKWREHPRQLSYYCHESPA